MQIKTGKGSQTAAETGKGIMNYSIRLSRLSHPRATMLAMILLAAVFLLFGLFANALHPELAMQAPEKSIDVLAILRNLC